MNTKSIFSKSLLVTTMFLALASCKDDFSTPSLPTGNALGATMATKDEFTLWTAITQRLGIYTTLNNPTSGSFTVFAPSDAAMITYLSTVYAAQLPLPVTEASLINFIDGLSSSSNPTLSSFNSTLVPVLNYHIVSSEIKQSGMTGTQTFATLNSARLSISNTGTSIILNGNSATNGATVTTFDYTASNGVAHVIDRVMAVPSTATVLTSMGLSVSYATNPPTVTGGTTSDTNDNNFNLLAALIRYTGATPTLLPNTTPLPDFTIFQVNDGVVRAYLQGINASLTTEALCYTYISTLTASSGTSPSLDELTTLVKYHVVPGRYLAQDLTNGQVLTTLLGNTGSQITVSITAGPVYTLQDINGAVADPTVTTANILTNSGVLHTINGVLRPN